MAVPRGETVYLLSRESLQGVTVPDGDFTIWDDKRVTLNGYSGIHWTHATIHDATLGNDVRQFFRTGKKAAGACPAAGKNENIITILTIR